jgi:hypothetical protein
MKLQFIIPALLLTAAIACNQPQNGNSSSTTSQATENNEPKDSGVYFVNLKNGDTVQSPVIIQMGVKGKTVEPAGAVNAGKGHHHLIIDGSYIEKGQMVMKDSTHLHFGKGQMVDTLKLAPGSHSLTLQFADGAHMSYGKDWSSTITIFVK